jgi:hypothetical protein
VRILRFCVLSFALPLACGSVASAPPEVDAAAHEDTRAPSFDATADADRVDGGRDAAHRADAGRDAARDVDAGQDAAPLGCDAGEPGVACLAASGPTVAYGLRIAVDDENVYWSAGGPSLGLGVVMRAPRAGGTPVTLATGSPLSLIADGVDVYWGEAYTSGLSLKRVPVSGGAVVSLAPTQSFRCLAQDQDNIYWTDQGSGEGGSILTLAKAGGAVATLAATTGSAFQIAVDDTNVYWVEDTVMQVAKAGGTPVTLLAAPTDGTSPSPSCPSLAVAGDTLYLVLGSGDGYDNQLVTVPVTGAANPTVLVASNDPYAVVANSTALFWLGLGTELDVDEMPIDGGVIATLARPLAHSASDLALASDGTLYWSTNLQIDSISP